MLNPILLITQVLAQGSNHVPPDGVIPSLPSSDTPQAPELLFGVAADAIDIMFATGAAIALIIILFLGIHLVISRGKPEEFKKSLMGLVYIAVGFTIMGIAYALVRSIFTITF